MSSIFITPTAENDLINIWLYIARDKPQATDRVYQAAEETFNTILAMASIGTLYRPRRTQLKGVRFLPVSSYQNYLIYYRELEKGIEIIRILHALMDKQRHLESKD